MDRLTGRVIIDFDRRADPIAGCIHAGDGSPRSFAGWTGLFAALRAATSEDARGQGATGRAAAPPDEPDDAP
jgi:hypothetical protein